MNIYELIDNLNKLSAEQLEIVRQAVTCCSSPQVQQPTLKSSPACLAGGSLSLAQEPSGEFQSD